MTIKEKSYWACELSIWISANRRVWNISSNVLVSPTVQVGHDFDFAIVQKGGISIRIWNWIEIKMLLRCIVNDDNDSFTCSSSPA